MSEFAFREANWEIISFHVVHTRTLGAKSDPLSNLRLLFLPYPFSLAGLSLFPVVIGLPFSLA